ncbi:hypothetical protein E5288_WYG007084 [Bos mutus]|uniref:Uncharacterized protein n=1 Tax=Bos mutus TaxID=72004 RepID=A0A6B0QPA9_9CETA|nr:hypothetical protein [Bos mutus]
MALTNTCKTPVDPEVAVHQIRICLTSCNCEASGEDLLTAYQFRTAITAITDLTPIFTAFKYFLETNKL